MRKCIIQLIANILRIKIYFIPLFAFPRNRGKGYLQYNQFISSVKSGKKTMVIGVDYVVLSMDHYKELKQEKEGTWTVEKGA